MSKRNNSCLSSHPNETNPVFSTEGNTLINPTVSANFTVQAVDTPSFIINNTTGIHIYHIRHWKLISKLFNKNTLICSYTWSCILPQISQFLTPHFAAKCDKSKCFAAVHNTTNFFVL